MMLMDSLSKKIMVFHSMNCCGGKTVSWFVRTSNTDIDDVDKLVYFIYLGNYPNFGMKCVCNPLFVQCRLISLFFWFFYIDFAGLVFYGLRYKHINHIRYFLFVVIHFYWNPQISSSRIEITYSFFLVLKRKVKLTWEHMAFEIFRLSFEQDAKRPPS